MSQYQIPLRLTLGLVYVIGILANCMLLFYFIKKQHKGLGNKLLMLLNVLDLLVCVTSVTTAVPWQIYLNSGSNMAYILWFTSTSLYAISYDCTGFTTCLVSVTRTIKVCRPFYSIRGIWTGVSFLLYFLCSFAREFSNLYFQFIKRAENRETIKMTYAVAITSGITACIIAVVLSSIITAHRLLREKKLQENISESNRHATITILILSSTFCVLNAALVSVAVISFCIRIKVIEDNDLLWAFRDIILYSTQCLNSAINPIIYLARKKEMRQFVRELWKTVQDKLTRSGTKPAVELTVRIPN